VYNPLEREEANMVEVTVHFRDDQFERLMERARKQGFVQPGDYLAALADDDLDQEDEPNAKILAELQQAWLEMRHGEGISAEEFKRRMERDE
jgi:hypothetical protein